MKNTYSIAMLSLLVLAPAAFAGSKMDTAKRCAKSFGRVAVSTGLTVATAVIESTINDKCPDNWFLKNNSKAERWGKMAVVSRLARHVTVIAGTQFAREKVAKYLDSKLSNDNTTPILDGSRAASLLFGSYHHWADDEGLKKSMQAVYRTCRTSV